DGPRQEVAHLEADQGLPTARRRFRDVDIEAVIGRPLVLEVHLPLDFIGFNRPGHNPRSIARANVMKFTDGPFAADPRPPSPPVPASSRPARVAPDPSRSPPGRWRPRTRRIRESRLRRSRETVFPR